MMHCSVLFKCARCVQIVSRRGAVLPPEGRLAPGYPTCDCCRVDARVALHDSYRRSPMVRNIRHEAYGGNTHTHTLSASISCSWGQCNYSRTPLIRPPSGSHWCGRIRGMVAREGFVYEQKPLSVTRNVVV